MTDIKARFGSALLLALCLSGCQSLRPSLPSNAPLIGEAILSSQEKRPNYAVSIPVCNRGPEMMKAKVFISGAPKDLVNRISGLSAGAGSWLNMTLCQINEQRTRPVYIRLEWQRGRERGTKRFVIAPEQTNVVKVK